MKNRIRLTESDLHRIIKESVKRALNELDYKTLASAGDKAMSQDTSYWREKGYEPRHDAIEKAADSRVRGERLYKAAKDAFNHDYGYKKNQLWDDDYASVGLGGDFDATEEFSPHVVGYKSKGYGNPKKLERGRDSETYQKSEPEDFFQGDEDAAKAFRSADDEIKNWKKGNYKYEKGKGYTKKK